MEKANYSTHQNLLKKILLETSINFPEVTLFQAHVGMFYTKKGTPIKIGTVGFPDLHGYISINNYAYAIFIEVKSGKSGIKKNSAQDKFRKKFLIDGALHIEARSVNEVQNKIQIFKRQLSDKES